MKKILILGLIFVILGVSFFSYCCFNEKEILVVGADYFPYSYFDGEKYTGIYIDIIDKIFEKEGINYKIELMDWEKALENVQLGKADVLMSASYAPERESFIYYTDEQRNYEKTNILPSTVMTYDPYVFFIRTEDFFKFNVTSYEKIREGNYRVGIVNKVLYFNDLFDAGLNFYSFSSSEEILNALEQGIVDLDVDTRDSGLYSVQNLNLSDKITFIPWELGYDVSYIVFSKGKKSNLYLRDKFYADFIEMKKSGELDKIYQKYGVDLP